MILILVVFSVLQSVYKMECGFIEGQKKEKGVSLIFANIINPLALVHFQAENNGVWVASKLEQGPVREPAGVLPATSDEIRVQALI